MIIIPTVKPEILKALEADFGTSISASIWMKLINNQNWIEKSLPIGALLFFYNSQKKADSSAIERPNANIWIELKGQTISDPNSILNGQTLPDLRDLFLKGSNVQGTIGGQSTINIQHSHHGRTGYTDDRQEQNSHRGTDFQTGASHYHALSLEWSTAEPIIPKFFSMQTFMRFK